MNKICPNDGTKLEARQMASGRVLVCPKCKFHAPTNKLRIKEIWAWVSVDPNGHEGIICFEGPGGIPHPAIGADAERLKALRPIAEQAATSGIPIRLLKFSQRELIDEIVKGN